MLSNIAELWYFKYYLLSWNVSRGVAWHSNFSYRFLSFYMLNVFMC